MGETIIYRRPTFENVDEAVDAAVASLVDSSPSALDTLNELAAALGDDAAFSTTVANAIAAKVAKAGDTMTGDLVLPAARVSGIGGLSARNFVGRKTTVGAPTTGTWAINDEVVDSNGTRYRCTVAGTPGTWVSESGTIGIRKAAVGDDVFSSGVTGDTVDRHVVGADGTHHWGPGNAALDTNLYRQAADVLGTDDDFLLATHQKALKVTNSTSTRVRVLFVDGSNNLLVGPVDAGINTMILRFGGSNMLTLGSSGIVVLEATNVVLGTTTGSKIGTATTQKLGFWNAAPVVQPTNVANPAGGAIIDSEARTAIDAILSRLETIGLFAA